jgi:hypothetical protein
LSALVVVAEQDWFVLDATGNGHANSRRRRLADGGGVFFFWLSAVGGRLSVERFLACAVPNLWTNPV